MTHVDSRPNFRNVAIVAHVDHGKTTLVDAMLRQSGALSHRGDDAIERLMQDRTALVIAHRLATVRNADQILVLEAGRAVEQGTHAALIERNGLYRRLYDLQFRDPEPAA